MSAEKLKGCRPVFGEGLEHPDGVVDHSTKMPGGGSKDPMPLKSVSADNSHSMNPAPGSKESGVKSGPLITHICRNCVYGSLRWCTHPKGFPRLVKNINHKSGEECVGWKTI